MQQDLQVLLDRHAWFVFRWFLALEVWLFDGVLFSILHRDIQAYRILFLLVHHILPGLALLYLVFIAHYVKQRFR